MFWLQAFVKIALIVGVLVNMAAILLWVERKQSAMMQNRIGPNRAAIVIGSLSIRAAGLVHSIADGIKMVWKEDWEPKGGDKTLYRLAPIIALVPALCLFAVIPFGPTLHLDHLRQQWQPEWLAEDPSRTIPMRITSLDVGLLYVFAVAGAGVIGAALAGWSSNNKFALLGGLRAASQMVSYEVAMGLSLVGAFMVYQSVQPADMVAWQMSHCWGILVQPLAFVLFFTSAIAETKRVPFDVPEGESEVVAGYFTEYAGLKFGMFASGELVEVCTSSALLTVVFLGGWQFPFVQNTGLEFHYLGLDVSWHWAHVVVVIVGLLSFVLKVLGLVFLQLQIRWTLPRFRYDQIMMLGWRILLPAALVNVLITGFALLFINGVNAGGPTP
ncbi:MAG: NADH-quinone oxidoreductase subunit H [Myxococcales bacterium]|nr:NADH-quinone oxidoreductase subunit H [Myxococcales bacterium]